MTLWLYNNQIGDEGAIAIALSLKENNALTSLHLCNKYNNYITQYLDENKISDEGKKAIKEAQEVNTKIQVDLCNTL